MSLKRRMALAFAFLVMLSLAIPVSAADEASAQADLARTAAGYAMTYGGASAVQYAVWEDGAITLSGQSGVYFKTENRVLTGEDLFGIGSVSKVYTTAVMMKLVEAGMVTLDAPVTRYLPDFTMADERYRDITVRMLLNHSSGLMGSSTNDAFLFADDDQIATRDLLNRLSTQSLKAAPGEIAVYCNDGFTLAELVIEAVSGKAYGTFLRDTLLTPAGLSNTVTPQDEFDTDRLVKIYASTNETRALPQDSLGIVGCGGLYATASDLAAFGGMLSGTSTQSGLLAAPSVQAMANAEYKRGIWPEDDADLIAYGLGWDSVKAYPFALNNIQGLYKVGDTLYYHAALLVIPEYRLAAAVLSSGGISTYNLMAANQMLLAALREKGISVTESAPTFPTATPAEMPPELMNYSGSYGALTQQMEVRLSKNTLTIDSLTIPSAPEEVFAYYSDGTFRDRSGQGTMLKLVQEKNGVTYLYQKAWGDLPGLGLLPVSNYLAQKLPDNPIPAETQAAWDRVSASSPVPVNMKYTSQLYSTLFSATPSEASTNIPGYLGAMRIVDKTTTRNELRIPNQGSRDSQEMILSEKDGVTYYTTTQGILYADAAKVVQNLYAGPGAYTTVASDGFARWYAIGPGAAGKTMTVTLPSEAGFYVYHPDGSVAYSSVAYGDTMAVLPEGGFLVFAGAPGARFHLTFS